VVNLLRRLALVLFLGTCAFGGGSAAVVLAPRLGAIALAQPGPSGGAGVGGNGDLQRTSERFEAVARKVMPAVVAVEAKKPAGGKRAKAEEESGSGVLIRVEGQRGVLVLTNNHVIADAPAKGITVSLADDRIVRPAQVWADPESDVALLRLEGLDNAATAPLGDSDSVRVGQWVLAFGSPFGLNQTMTHGIISARERGQVGLGSTIRIKDFLQTDAAINPGSSGGPLVNLEGEVIGVNTAIASHSNSSSGVAFSIPVNLVKRVMKQLLEKGSVARGYLGMQLAESFEAADALRLGLDRAQGALVETVYPDTPASAAGLKVNDVVLQVDGTAIRNENHLINIIAGTPAGQKVRLQVWREKRTMTLDAVVGDWSKGQGRFRPTP
jgi:S1-C subfamily serine protease